MISFLREQSGRLGFGGARGLLLRPRLAAAAEAGGAAAAEEAPPEAYGVVADPARIELDLGSGGHVLHLEHLQEQREKLRRLQAEAAAAAAAPRAPRRRPRKPQRGGAQAASGEADAAAAALAKAAAELDQEELRRRARILCEVVCLFQVRQDANALEQRSGGDGEEYVPARPALPQPQPVPLPRQDLFSSARLEAAEKARAAMAARAAEWGGKKVIVKPRGIAEDPEGREWMEVDAETLWCGGEGHAMSGGFATTVGRAWCVWLGASALTHCRCSRLPHAASSRASRSLRDPPTAWPMTPTQPWRACPTRRACPRCCLPCASLRQCTLRR